ncbi:MAG: uracil-DNA glycosylase family protein [Atopobiaceae bacterium]|jgi:uracil-DNA glycosylase
MSEESIETIKREIMQDPANAHYTQAGISPLFSASEQSRVVIIGQAPGRVAQEIGIPWRDKSGDRLREWLGINDATFYDPQKVALIPMDFYFPGKGCSGDLPPRANFAATWHPKLFALMQNVQLTVLIGSYATHAYLPVKKSRPLTDMVRNWQEFGPTYFPLVHPSPRNQLWMSRNPWFEKDVLPQLKARVHDALS